MKRSMLCIALTAAALSVPVAFAVDEHHPDAGKKQSPATKTAPAKPAAAQGMDMSQMQGNMKKMQEQMEKMQKTTDPKERQKLMGEHMQTMMVSMKTMRGMGGSMMMEGSQSGGMMTGGKKDGMPTGDMMKHHEMMEQRMDMMQMMMGQMMQHQKALEESPK